MESAINRARGCGGHEVHLIKDLCTCLNTTLSELIGAVHFTNYNGYDWLKPMDSRCIVTARLASNGRSKSKLLLLRAMRSHLDPWFAIERSWYNRVNSPKRRLIAIVDRDESIKSNGHALSRSLKMSSSRRNKAPAIIRQIRCVFSTISRAVCFPILLTNFRTNLMYEIIV